MRGDLACEEGIREELIGGEFVMMAPASINHTFISGNIFGIFWNYLRKKKCTPISDGSTVYLTEKDHFVPDVMVVCDPGKISSDGVHGAPGLVVEVLSPGTAKNDKTRKKEVYAKCSVREYWIVSPGDRSIEVYRGGTSGGFVLHNVYTLYPAWELARMTEEQRSAVEGSFRCSLFDDLEISLEDVFHRTF